MSFAINNRSSFSSNSEIGSILRFGVSSTPTGFLPCNGQAVSRSTYYQLFNKIGTTFGVGDGSTTFNIPFDTSLKQYALTVTGTNWTTARAVGVPYKVNDDTNGETWRLRFNIEGTLSVAAASPVLTVDGVTFKNGINQSITTYINGSSAHQAYTTSNASTIEILIAATSTVISISGDVELESKPTFVDDNGSDYSINQYIRYEPKTALQGVNTSSTLSISAAYTIVNDETNIFKVTTGSSANVVITLPSAAANADRVIEILKVDSGTKFVEIARAGSDTIRGSATSIYAIQQGESIRLLSDGTSEWMLLGDPTRTVSAFITNSGTPTITRQDGTWISSLTDNSTGSTTLSIVSGTFLAAPNCTCSTDNAGVIGVVGGNSSAIIVSTNVYNGSAFDANFNVVAVGKK